MDSGEMWEFVGILGNFSLNQQIPNDKNENKWALHRRGKRK